MLRYVSFRKNITKTPPIKPFPILSAGKMLRGFVAVITEQVDVFDFIRAALAFR